MRHASSHNYRNTSFIVDVAMGQIPRSTERISSFLDKSHTLSIARSSRVFLDSVVDIIIYV